MFVYSGHLEIFGFGHLRSSDSENEDSNQCGRFTN